MIYISVVFFIYIITVIAFIIGFDLVKESELDETVATNRFTVIIPFRNEAENLPKLLDAIHQLNYPTTLVDFIFVNDASTDKSISIINTLGTNNQHHIRVIENERKSNSPKKDAITAALKVSTKEWIITTDADCILPINWLNTIDAFIQQNDCNLIVAPVNYISNNRFIHQFQDLDFLSLQATTIAAFGLKTPFLCNGANLIYRKQVFEQVNGFINNNNIASGDDVFLLEKFIKLDKGKVKHLKSRAAIVQTFPVNTINELINQRLRWASKTSNYNLLTGKLIGLIVLLGNGCIAIIPLLILFLKMKVITALSFTIMKLLFDYLLIKKCSDFYQKNIRFSSYLKSSILYPYFTLLIFLKSLVSKYNWKGRSFKK
mgnify:CR=1 FL=1